MKVFHPHGPTLKLNKDTWLHQLQLGKEESVIIFLQAQKMLDHNDATSIHAQDVYMLRSPVCSIYLMLKLVHLGYGCVTCVKKRSKS